MPELFAGDLGRIHLSSLLQLAEAEAFCGWLTLGDAGRVGMRDGEVIDAQCGPLGGRDALRTLFFATSGRFSFTDDEPPSGAALASMMQLIMDGVRIVDEWERLGPSVLAPRRGSPGPSAAGQAGRVLELLDGTRALFEAVAASEVPPVVVLDAIASLVDEGALMEMDAPRSGPVPSPIPRQSAPTPAPEAAPADRPSDARPKLDYETAMSLGREALRAGQYGDAEEAFDAALAARPDDYTARHAVRRARRLRQTGATDTLASWVSARTRQNADQPQ